MEKTTESSKNSQRHVEAKKYLDEYDIETVVSEMLNSLLHEKDKHPYVFMIKYLTGLMSEEERKEFNLSIPEPYPTGRPVVKYPKFDSSSANLLKKYLTKEEWEKLRHVKTKYGNNINAMTKLCENKPSDPIGCVLVDGDCLNSYSTVLNNIIAEVHNIPADYTKLNEFQLNSFIQLKSSDLPLITAQLLEKVDKMILSFSRNISEYPFNHFSSGTNKLASIETLLIKNISGLGVDKIIPEYKIYSLDENREEAEQLLDYINFDMEWLAAAGLKQGWPDYRKVIATEDKSLVILINFSDHLQIYICKEKGNVDVVQMYNNAIEILKQMSLVINFESSKQLGFLTSNLNMLGAGLNMSTWVTFSQLPTKKLMNGTSITDILKGLKFDSFDGLESGNNGKLFSSESFKLHFETEKNFISNYLSKLCGLSQLDSNGNLSNEITFDKLGLPANEKDPNNIVNKVYEECHENLKYQLSAQGNNINSLVKYHSINPSNDLGIIIHENSEYQSFYPMLQKYILLSQNFDTSTTDHIHKPDEPKQMAEIANDDITKISNVSICVMRNIEGYPFPHCKQNSNGEVEELIRNTIETINSKGHFADYLSLSDDSTKEQALELIKNNKLTLYHDEKMKECQMDCDYPSNRGVIKFVKENLYAIVNDVDHIKFTLSISEPKEKFGSSLVSLLKVVNELSKQIIFSYDMKLGFLTTSPKYVGTGLDIKLQLKLTTISKENLLSYLESKDNIQFNVAVLPPNEDNTYQVEVTNKVTIGMSETELLINLLLFLNEIFEQDK